MEKLLTWIQVVAVPALGPAGILLVSFLDSSFLSLPHVNDVLLVGAAAADPTLAWLYAGTATAGSLLGCSAWWFLGRRGGEALLSRRFGDARVARTRGSFERWGGWTLVIPALLPPPAPFKVFVIAAGVFGYPYRSFLIALLLGRGLRYGALAGLGAVYGDEARGALRVFDAWVLGNLPALLAAAIAAAAAYAAFRLRQSPSAGPAGAPD